MSLVPDEWFTQGSGKKPVEQPLGRHYRLTQIAEDKANHVLVIEYFEPVALVGTYIGPHWFADVSSDEKDLAEHMVKWLNEQEPLKSTPGA